MARHLAPLPLDPAVVTKIAVLRAKVLGDFVFVLPALGALRRTFPAAEIVYLGKPWHQTFVPGRVTSIDRVVAVPEYPGVGAPENFTPERAAVRDFFAAMRREKFDLAFQMHGGGGNSNLFLLELGAKRTAGLRAAGAAALDINLPYVFYQNEVLRYLELVSLVGARTPDIAPCLQPTAADRQEAEQAAAAAGVTPGGRYVVLHAGASDPRRRWPPEKFAAAAGHFADSGLSVLLTGSGDEAAIIRKIRRDEPRARSMCGMLSLGGLAGLLAGAALVISNDTGPLHLAAAVGAKTVGLYWVGNMMTAAQLTRRRHRPLVSWTICCPVCGTASVDNYSIDVHACDHKQSFIADIPVERVLEEAHSLLDEAS